MQRSTLWVFFLSGLAALIYQIVWQRLLVFFSGSDVYSSTLVVAAFMAGLGVGHLAGGHLADRSSRRTNLLFFAIAELAIAAFSLLSRPLYYDLLYVRLGPLAIPAPAMAAVLFASLLWPTFFMGVSLPLLARSFTENVELAASRVGALYGINTLGAAAGALITTWLLLPQFGLGGSLWIGAGLNVTCAVLVFRLLPSREPSASPAAALGDRNTPDDVPIHSETHVKSPAFAVWALVYGLSGFLALSLEIVWFRLLGVIVKSTAYTFGTLLAIYLAGVGLGSLVGRRYAGRARRPAPLFLGLQALVGLSAALLFAGFVGLVEDLSWLHGYFAGYEPLDVLGNLRRIRLRDLVEGRMVTQPGRTLPWEAAVLYFLVPASLIGLPTVLMGLSFPVLQRVVQSDLSRLGRRVGFLLVANILGSVAGTLLTGWLALNVLGVAGTMKLLAFVSGAFAVAAAWGAASGISRPVLAAGAAGVVAATALFVPGAATLWARLHGTRIERIVFAEDATGLSVVRVESPTPPIGTMVFVNGLGQSAMPYGDIHTALGLLPAFIHPEPKNVAIIGLGSGDTVHAVAGRREIQNIVCIEIIGPQLVTLKELAARYPYAGLLNLLNDPRIDHVAADGRLALMRSAAQFDIIEADALRPNSAYSGNLYSDGYFALLRDRLRPNGLAVTWSPTVRVHNGFVRTFPHVVSFPGILVGSRQPVVVDREAVLRRLSEPPVREHYARAGIDVGHIVKTYLVEQWRYTPEFDRGTLTDFNTDLFPKDEFNRPAAAWHPPGAPGTR